MIVLSHVMETGNKWQQAKWKPLDLMCLLIVATFKLPCISLQTKE